MSHRAVFRRARCAPIAPPFPRTPALPRAYVPLLFMVIEKFRNQDPRPVGERFRLHGRMMPDDISYVSSWIDPATARCFQLMEAPHADALRPWIDRWSDLVEFEVIPVVTSKAYWESIQSS